MKSLRWRLPLAVIFLAVIFMTAFVFFAPRPDSFEKVVRDYTSSELVLLDQQGLVLHESRRENSVRRLPWTPLHEVPENFKQLILKAEDQRFQQHFGFDFLAFAKAGMMWLQGAPLRGASTITMQVTELLNGGRGKTRRHWQQKLKQIYAAIGLENHWSKNQILEAYLNLVYYRGELQGIGAAAQGLFGKAPFGLNEAESAVIISLIRAPNAAAEKVLDRACRLLQKTNCQDADEWKSQLTEKYWIQPLERLAPHVARHMKVDKGAGRIKTSLNRGLQIQVQEILRAQVEKLRAHNLTEASAVVLDNKTGQVLAYVGNIGDKSQSPYVDAAFALRQAGSTLKPFIYGLAIEKKLITAATILQDKPTDVAVATGIYRPTNYDRRFRENVSARVALASSLNIPAVQVLEAVGVENAMEMFTNLGFTGLERPDFYGPSVALGAVDVKLLELTNAYRALANQGVWSPVSFVPQAANESTRVVLSPATSAIVSQMLADRGSRGGTFGWENALATRFWTAVKTGTSKDMRDNWCVGYSERYTVGVWAGNLSGEPMWNVSGVQGAAPAWLEIMNQLHRREPSRPPEPPPGVVVKKIRFMPLDIELNEWFLAGTEPPEETIRILRQTQSKLVYPADQTLVALDPDIPRKKQKIFFAVNDPETRQKLKLNGKILAQAQEKVGWQPYPGRFKLELIDAEGRPLDTIHFQVR